jgi:hypothetical protein
MARMSRTTWLKAVALAVAFASLTVTATCTSSWRIPGLSVSTAAGARAT